MTWFYKKCIHGALLDFINAVKSNCLSINVELFWESFSWTLTDATRSVKTPFIRMVPWCQWQYIFPNSMGLDLKVLLWPRMATEMLVFKSPVLGAPSRWWKLSGAGDRICLTVGNAGSAFTDIFQPPAEELCHIVFTVSKRKSRALGPLGTWTSYSRHRLVSSWFPVSSALSGCQLSWWFTCLSVGTSCSSSANVRVDWFCRSVHWSPPSP